MKLNQNVAILDVSQSIENNLMSTIATFQVRLLIVLVLVCKKNLYNSNKVLKTPALFKDYVFDIFSFWKERAFKNYLIF